MKINKLFIYTSRLEEQTEFYYQVLGLPIIHQTPNAVDFQIGNTVLSFGYKSKSTPYHFAITIPSNKGKEALEWLRSKVSILKYKDEELVPFPDWNAEALYFYDKDHNIVELIARKNIKNETNELFGSKHFLNISEIGLAVQQVADTYYKIKAIKDIPIYDGDLNIFCAAGDEDGLFIIIDKNKKDWIPHNDKAYPSEFIVSGDINFGFMKGEINDKMIMDGF